MSTSRNAPVSDSTTALRRPRRLLPGELAHAASVAAAAAGLTISATVIPITAPLGVVAIVPMGLLAYRHRLRAVIAAAVASALIAFLIIGMPGLITVLNCAYVGGLIGIVKRRGGGVIAVTSAALVAGAALGFFVTAVLLVLVPLRQLVFGVIAASLTAVADALGQIPGMAQAAGGMLNVIRIGFTYWPLLLVGYAAMIVMIVSLVGWWAMTRVLDRLGGIPDVHTLDVPPAELAGDAPVPAPVPVTLQAAGFRYPGAEHAALAPTDLTVEVGERLAVVGANGSGKSTLMLVLAGRPPTTGTVNRPGAVGLGRPGGTAVVLQHPETQVLGMRVADDVVWGLPREVKVDVDRLLEEVGLAGMGDRATSGLSGGELQRLAVAAALAREPRLLIADEVTSMVDQDGRNALLAVLAGLTEHRQMSLVQITHYDDEAESADRVISLSESGDNTAMVETAPTPAATVDEVPTTGVPVLELDRVTHEYAAGTPWSHTALRDVSFTVHEGEGLLIQGGNGSGKSTLAWVMAGLTTPTAGTALLDGKPAADQLGSVAIAFQAARIQLMRARVDEEVASAAGFCPTDHDRVVAALATVGLDAALARRRVDQLSGGQMRRLVLAGLLARKPRVLILDEPLAGLDAASQRGLVGLLTDLRRAAGLTVVLISHDFLGLEELCPRVLHLENGAIEVPVSPSAGGRS
jgi:energy-coupling factor transport system ATP-binding protein